MHISKCLVGRGKPPPVQVAVGSGSMTSHVCTLANTLVGARKTPPMQVAGDVHSKCKWVFALIDGRKNTTSASCRGSRPSLALVGAGCSNQMQVAQGQGLVRDYAIVQLVFTNVHT